MRAAIPKMLGDGDRRSIGRAGDVAAAIARDPALFARTIQAMRHESPVVRMRAADAAEKASRSDQSLLRKHKATLVALLRRELQPEVQWHLLQMLPRVPFTPAQRRRILKVALERLSSQSRIVAAEALSALFALSSDDRRLWARAVAAARTALASPSPSLRARARKHLRPAKLGKPRPRPARNRK